MIFNMTGSGSGGVGKLPVFTYTGQYQFIDDGKDGRVQNWRIKFLTSGVLTFQKLETPVDVFLVGGGGSGSRYYGQGGGGGYTLTEKSIALQPGVPYTIEVGSGGSAATNSENQGVDGGNTVFGNNYTAAGGKGAVQNKSGGNGGSGGSGSNSGLGGVDGADGTGDKPGKGQGTTTRAFGEASGELYSTGGNGKDNTTGKDGLPNTGDGGCGGDGSVMPYAGGSGIAIIRNHREAGA